MSEENKQKENKEEKVKVKIQGREYEFDIEKETKLNNLWREIDVKDRRVALDVGSLLSTEVYVYHILLDEDSDVRGVTFKPLTESDTTISFTIGGVLNKNIKVCAVVFNSKCKICSVVFEPYQRISFIIDDTKKNIEASGVSLDDKGDICDVEFKISQTMSCVIAGMQKNIEASGFSLGYNGDINGFIFAQPQKISFKIGGIENKDILVKRIYFNDDRIINIVVIDEDVDDYFYYKKKKYKLSFKAGEIISFDAMGNLQDECIKKSRTRMNQIEEQDRIYNLENRQDVAMKEDRRFVRITGGIGLFFVALALILCFILAKNFDKMSFVYLLSFLDPKHETFNKYTFLYEILKRTPIIVLIILGFKFLQLAFERLRLIGKVEQVRNYIALTADDDTKKQLLKMIAIPFFAPKKVKSRFFDRLIDKIDKLSINIPIGSEQENSGVISKDKQNHS